MEEILLKLSVVGEDGVAVPEWAHRLAIQVREAAVEKMNGGVIEQFNRFYEEIYPTWDDHNEDLYVKNYEDLFRAYLEIESFNHGVDRVRAVRVVPLNDFTMKPLGDGKSGYYIGHLPVRIVDL